jgi:hypothetical protein
MSHTQPRYIGPSKEELASLVYATMFLNIFFYCLTVYNSAYVIIGLPVCLANFIVTTSYIIYPRDIVDWTVSLNYADMAWF